MSYKKSRSNKTVKAPITPFAGQEPGHIVHIDLMEALPRASGYHAIVVFIDSFSRWSEAVALRDTKAETIARVFLNTWIARQGVPCQLHSDRGGNVDTAKILQEVVRMLNVTKTRNYAYRPQTNAHAERVIGTIKNMLWKFCQENPKNWVTLLDQVMFAYRTAEHSSTGYSAFFLDKGRHPRIPMDIVMGTSINQVLGETYSESAYNLYTKLQDTYRFVRENVKFRQDYSKKRYDTKCHIKKYEIGQFVYVWKPTPAYCTYRKFYDNFRGPFKIVEKLSDHGYKIELSPDKYDVVHMEHLKLAEEPAEDAEISLEGYFGDVTEENDDATAARSDGSASESQSDDETVSAPTAARDVGRSRRPAVFVMPRSDAAATGNNDGNASRPRRVRRQHYPYQHIP